MRVLDLFSGIGGFALGLERAGMQTAMFCEIEPFCRRVLAKHWPGVPIHDDVRTLGARTLAEHGVAVDLVCGGFPCQDISVAGKGAGLGGERSGLWFEYLRVIEETRPRWVVIENVPALRSRGLDVVLRGLAALGYDAEWHCIPAAAVGAPHRRDRVWLVAHAGSEGRREVLRGAHGHEGADGAQHMLTAGGHGSCRDVADSYDGRRPGQQRREPRGENGTARGSGAAVANPHHQRLEIVLDGASGQQPAAERTHAWTVEPDVGGSTDGLPGWLDRTIGRGMSHAESRRAAEILRGLWSPHVSQALRRAAGGLDRLQQAQVLFSFLRQHQDGTVEARLLVAGEEAPEDWLRGLRHDALATGAPRRSGRAQQFAEQHPDALRPVPYFLARDGEASWASSGWEDAIPRVAHGVPDRVNRLRALGNSVVPQVVEAIGRAIMKAERA